MAATKTATQLYGKKKLVGRSSLSQLRHKRKKPWDKKRNHYQAQQSITKSNKGNYSTTLIQNICNDDDSHWNNNNNDCDLIYNRLPRTLLELKYKNKLKDQLSQQMIISRSIYSNFHAPAAVQDLSKNLAQNSTSTMPSKTPLSTTNKHDCLPILVEDSSETCCSSMEEAQSSSWEYNSPSTSRRSSNSSSSSYCDFPSIPNAMEDASMVTPNRNNTHRQDTDEETVAAAAADAVKESASITPSPKKIPRALLELASFNDVGIENCEPTRHKRIGKSNQQFGFSNRKQHRPIPSNYAFLFEECNSDVRKLVRKYGTKTNETKPNKRGRRKQQLWKWED